MTAPVTSQGINAQDVGLYLESQGYPTGLWRRGEGVADALALTSGPDAMLVVTRSFRPGWLTEERGTQWMAFQLRTVGPQANYGEAETLAFQADAILQSVQKPVTMGSVRVSAVQDLGSGPTLLTKDNAQRTHFTASYAFAVPGLS